MGNLENGPDIERFGEDFARDVRNADALREKLQKESKDEINQYNKEQTERIKIEHQKEIEQSIASFEALASNDWEKHFPTGNYIGSTLTFKYTFTIRLTGNTPNGLYSLPLELIDIERVK